MFGESTNPIAQSSNLVHPSLSFRNLLTQFPEQKQPPDSNRAAGHLTLRVHVDSSTGNTVHPMVR